MVKILLAEMLFGSRLYGTATPASDTDIKAVHIPSPEELILGRSSKVFSEQTKENQREKNSSEDLDYESFSLAHFMKMLMEGQAAPIDMIFAPPSMMKASSKEWQWLQDNKWEFISKECTAFVSYAKSQANKYAVKGDRVSSVRAVVELLESLKDSSKTPLGNFDNFLSVLENQHEFVSRIDIVLANGMCVRHLQVCGKKAPYTSSLGEALTTYKKMLDNYGKRSLAAETLNGVDWKGLSHSVRIAKEAISVLNGEDIVFPLPYAKELLDIKTGQLPYAQVADLIEELLIEVEDAASSGAVRDEPNRQLASEFIVSVYGREISQWFNKNREYWKPYADLFVVKV